MQQIVHFPTIIPERRDNLNMVECHTHNSAKPTDGLVSSAAIDLLPQWQPSNVNGFKTMSGTITYKEFKANKGN